METQNFKFNDLGKKPTSLNGGAERRLSRLLKHFGQKGHVVVV